MAVLRGNLAPRGAIIKQSAATPKLLQHTGRAVVFDSVEDMAARIDSPDLDVGADDVLVLRNAGPVGAPGMPEAGYLPIPKKLATQGVKDMVRLSDARMSGTAFGAIVLHMTPEAALGGPLALVRNGDSIRLDVAGRRLDLLVDDAELARRRQDFEANGARGAAPAPTRGYAALFHRSVLQADEGCDFDFLVPGRGFPMTFPRPRGVIAATATPIDAEQRPDLPRLLRHCRALLDDGCDAINLLGTTGEATAFSVEQRLDVMRAVAEGGLPLDRFMVGTGLPALDDTVRLTRAACELGFAGALVLPPFFYPAGARRRPGRLRRGAGAPRRPPAPGGLPVSHPAEHEGALAGRGRRAPARAARRDARRPEGQRRRSRLRARGRRGRARLRRLPELGGGARQRRRRRLRRLHLGDRQPDGAVRAGGVGRAGNAGRRRRRPQGGRPARDRLGASADRRRQGGRSPRATPTRRGRAWPCRCSRSRPRRPSGCARRSNGASPSPDSRPAR